MNNKLFLLSLLAIAGATVYFASQARADTGLPADSVALSKFASFRSEFGKKYSSPAELEYRLGVFQANLEVIEAHNAGSSTYTLEVNEFADLTYDEFAAKFLGVAEDFSGSARCEKTGDEALHMGDEKEVDWVKAGVVHPVKNQAACGSCWAFSSTGALESALAIFKGEKGLDISEQELVDCSRSYGNGGCQGGLMHFAFDYILDKGINNSKDYAYNARDGKCKSDISGKGPNHLKGCRQVKKGVDNLIAPLRAQPISVAFYVQNDFRFYKNGVYNPTGCTSHPNHAVLAVGFKLDFETPYFHIKNSWGTAWGDQGYFKMAIGKNSGTCQIGGHDWNYYPVV